MNLAIYYQDAGSSNLYVVDTGLVTLGDGGVTLSSNTWDIQGTSDVGVIPAAGCALSPDGTKLARAAANGSTKQYKVQVWDVGATPSVASTLDITTLTYLVNATKLKEFTKTAVVTDTITAVTWVNAGASASIDTQVIYGVLDLQVDNSGNVWWLEHEGHSATTEDAVNIDDANPPEYSFKKANVQQLLLADSDPTNLGTFLTYSTASPGNGTFATADNPATGGYCPGGFIPVEIWALWDGPRARVLGRARINLTNVPSYDTYDGSCDSQGADPDIGGYFVGGTASSILGEFDGTTKDGVFEPDDIITQTNSGTHYVTETTVQYSYLDQVPTVVFQDTAACDTPAGFVATGFPSHCWPVGRTNDGNIAAATHRAADNIQDEYHAIVQDSGGTVTRWSATDTTDSGTFCGNFSPYGSASNHILIATNNDFLWEGCAHLRPATDVASALTISDTPDTVSPSNPDTLFAPDQDISTRDVVTGFGITIDAVFYGSEYPVVTVSGA